MNEITHGDGIESPEHKADIVKFVPQALAQLGRDIVGERSIQDFCAETKLSRSLVSRLLNGNLSAPPTVRTIYRFAGEKGSEVIDKMLEACGYPTTTLEYVKELQKDKDNLPIKSSDAVNLNLAQNPAGSLSMLVNCLKEKGYGDQYNIDFRSEGTFAISPTIKGWTLACVSAFCTDMQDVETVWRKGLLDFARALTYWNPAETIYFILTNSDISFAKFKKLPNLAYKLAILTTSDGQKYTDQFVIAPMGTSDEEKDEVIRNFPVNLIVQNDTREGERDGKDV